ncbi:nodulin-like, Major facilitator superfamily domain protein [Artemisia annua]|uniref:Nodulin-like, Major facilitator superfamily domain protein n=1 Tax=Artemisia annua TaxID=35608 RepID=A0A2U1QCU6_ARTAN|nr:nodulin-like, Major facilitator superfamily domain protein [Artemisia annua]
MKISVKCRKWIVLIAAIWIQAFTGTNFDFPSYSTQMKSKLKINQVQLNYIAMGSDIGKMFGWCSGVVLLYFPTWVVLSMAAFLGLFGYGLQWLIIQGQFSLPYFMVFILSLSAGGSIPWFNTVCFVLNIKNFPVNWPLAVSLSVSFNGVTAALYNIIATKLTPNKNTSYLLLNALIPFIVAIAALGPILQQPGSDIDHQIDETVVKDDAYVFVCMYMLAAVTGLYLLFTESKSQNIYIVAILLIVLPFVFPKIVYLVKKLYRAYYSDGKPVEGPKYNLVEIKYHEEYTEESFAPIEKKNLLGWVFDMTIEKGRLKVLGEEHSVALLVTRCDFWLYYIAYFCGGALGLVYSNNLGQIAQSLGYISETKALVTMYSTCSFFGRLLSAASDLVACFHRQDSTRMYTTRTGMLMFSLVPLPIAFLLLVLSDHKTDLCVATGLIGICSGFLITTAVSLTSELFGSKSSGINHNILITNIPLGSLLYGVIAAVIYDDHIGISQTVDLDDKTVCIGRKCYQETFIIWGCICLVGLASSFLLFLRTKPAYELYYKKRKDKQSPTCADN